MIPLPRPALLGHRGASAERPENTLAAFARALELGADGIETDAHLTRDGAVILAHDDSALRTTTRARAACGCMIATDCCVNSFRFTRSKLNSILPASILDRSSRSLSNETRWSPDVLMSFR